MLRLAKGLACSLLLIATPAYAEEWHGFAQTREINGYVDVDSIRADGPVHTFDMFIGYMYGQGKEGEVYYAIFSMAADCGTGAFTIKALRGFDIDRKLFTSANDGAIEDPLAEADFANSLREFVCDADRGSSKKTGDPYRASDDYFGGF